MAVLALLGSLWLLQSARAATPVFVSNNRDLMLCFRKTGATGGTTSPNNLEVNIGQAALYYGAAQGSTVTTSVSGAQLSAVFDNLNDLTWSVAGCVPTVGDTGDSSVPTRTLWVTAPRSVSTAPAAPWVRNGPSTQGSTASEIKSVLDNASFYSGTVAGGANNTASAVVVPVGSNHEYGYFAGTLGNFANTFQGDVENITPANFMTGSAVSRSDLYELRPDSTGTQPAGKYLGYFELRNTGAVVFVAASTTTTPPAPTLSITISGTHSVISFASTAGATYTLYYTDAAGLLTPTSTWQTQATTITGNGSSQSFQDVLTASTRFYRVGVH